MKTQFFPALKLTALCFVLFAGIYSAVILGIAQVAAPNRGEGEVIMKEGRIVGFANVGQRFTANNYFWSRPSAVGYNAAGSGGSNKAGSNPAYIADVQSRITDLLMAHPGKVASQIPSELVTASGSGLDPDISPSAASFQAERISAVRGIPLPMIETLIAEHTERPLLGILGPVKINVLKLNLALDQLH